MVQWLTDNLGNICISLVLVIIVAAIICGIIKDKRQGKSSCGCNCSHCAMSGSCHYKKNGSAKAN